MLLLFFNGCRFFFRGKRDDDIGTNIAEFSRFEATCQKNAKAPQWWDLDSYIRFNTSMNCIIIYIYDISSMWLCITFLQEQNLIVSFIFVVFCGGSASRGSNQTRWREDVNAGLDMVRSKKNSQIKQQNNLVISRKVWERCTNSLHNIQSCNLKFYWHWDINVSWLLGTQHPTGDYQRKRRHLR